MSLPSPDKKQISIEIKKLAFEHGFDFCGFAHVKKKTQEKNKLISSLDKEYFGSMNYMSNNIDKREDPRLLLENCTSVVSLAINYYNPFEFNPDNQYVVSKYALGKDYHFIIKEKLYSIISKLTELSGVNTHRVFVDSAPVFERAWAVEAGLGWTGKNSCLIIPKKGSFYFLAEIFTTLELEYDNAFEKNYCGSCTKCIDACPTNAIVANGVIDSGKCISYHTIESKENIPDEIKANLNACVFGCDICQDVCPWNIKFAKQSRQNSFPPTEEILDLSKSDWHEMSAEKFNRLFKKTKSPLARTGYKKIMLNVSALKEG